ncbi:hypothetical protein ACRPLQ_25445 [Priestia sp. TRN 1309]|uniref:hypothetical protein n=1 Tax=Priestia sp. TRN 1309 TaxID=3420729 RepID=UPI003D7833F0
MSDKLRYENFVRAAFSFALKTPIERWGDPATLANTDYYDDDYLPRVKAAVSYSMEIFNGEIRERPNLPEEDYDLMDEILASVIHAPNTEVLTSLINRYKEELYQKYIV